MNRQNNRWLAYDREDVPVVPETKYPASVYGLSVVSSDGPVMPPYSFSHGVTVTKEVSLNVVETVVRPWMDRISNGQQYVFQ